LKNRCETTFFNMECLVSMRVRDVYDMHNKITSTIALALHCTCIYMSNKNL